MNGKIFHKVKPATNEKNPGAERIHLKLSLKPNQSGIKNEPVKIRFHTFAS